MSALRIFYHEDIRPVVAWLVEVYSSVLIGRTDRRQNAYERMGRMIAAVALTAALLSFGLTAALMLAGTMWLYFDILTSPLWLVSIAITQGGLWFLVRHFERKP